MESPFQTGILQGRVALVTGGGSGIGYEVARQLGLHGASIFLMGRRISILETAKNSLITQGIQAEYVQGDVRLPEDAKKAVDLTVKTFGKLNILVNNAAGNFLVPAEHLSPKGFKTVMEIDTIGTFNVSHAAFPALKRTDENNGGVIINISATLHYGATWYQAHASAAKAAIDSLTRSLCLEWGEYGIRVNGIAPGPVLNTAGFEKLKPRDDINGSGSVSVPAGRLGSTWDIAMASVFLASSAGSWISGETIVVDGGHWLYYPPSMSRDAVVKASRAVEAHSRQVGIPSKL